MAVEPEPEPEPEPGAVAGGLGVSRIEAARQSAEAQLEKARADLESTRTQLDRAGAQAGKLVASAGASTADLARAQMEDERSLIAICVRMRERDEAGRRMAERSAAAMPAEPAAVRAAERQAEQLQAAVRCGDWPGASSQFPASTALLIGLVSAACGNRLGPVLLDSYRSAIVNALKMVEAEVEVRCAREAAEQRVQGLAAAAQKRMFEPATPLERRAAELEMELAAAKAQIACVEQQDGALLAEERGLRAAAEAKLRQLEERVAGRSEWRGSSGAAAARRASGRGGSRIPGPRPG